MKAVLALLAGILFAPILIVVLLGSGATSCEDSTTAQGAAAHVNPASLPVSQVASYGPTELANAADIMNAAEALDLPLKAQIIGVMTAMGECGLKICGIGDAAGPDSRGLFEQRDNGAWGSYSDRMDPTISSTNFFKALQKVEGWQDLQPTIAAHRVQGNADPDHYTPYWEPAVTVVSKLSGIAIDPDTITNTAAATADATATTDANAVSDTTSSDGSCSVAAAGSYTSTGYQAPGEWGGYPNGRIPLSALTPVPWTGAQSYTGTAYLRPDAAASLINMDAAFKAKFGYDLAINEAYRDYAGQVAAKQSQGSGAAEPGTSNHGWALAIDVGDQGNDRIGSDTVEYQWLTDNAATYGWIHPAWAFTGPIEPWHWEFWGLKENNA